MIHVLRKDVRNPPLGNKELQQVSGAFPHQPQLESAGRSRVAPACPPGAPPESSQRLHLQLLQRGRGTALAAPLPDAERPRQQILRERRITGAGRLIQALLLWCWFTHCGLISLPLANSCVSSHEWLW